MGGKARQGMGGRAGEGKRGFNPPVKC